jgi:transcription elongation factor Elf1
MVKSEELSHEHEFICPVCGFPLCLVRRTIESTDSLAILVTCEGCDEYHGFVIDLDMTYEDLEDFTDYNPENYNAEISGYIWYEDDLDEEE